MSDRDSGAEIGAFFAGVLIGGLVGAATALLLAPQTGEETRKVIGKTSEEWRDRAQDVLEDAREGADATIADSRRRAERILDEARTKADAIVGEARERVETVIEDRRARGKKADAVAPAAPEAPAA